MKPKSLRHRNSLESPAGKESTQSDTSNNNSKYAQMAYTRRNIATPFSRGGNNKALSNSTRSLISYRKKFLIIIVITSLYTAFLYRRGQWLVFVFDSIQFVSFIRLELFFSYRWSFKAVVSSLLGHSSSAKINSYLK